jgi:hypothetical protein
MLQGIDLFDMGYLAGVTAGGYALSFPLDPGAQQQQQQQPMPASSGSASTDKAPAADGSSDADAAADGGQDCSKINLWAVAYRTDKRPLLPGCNCFACANHTRAYLHHLLQAHEMTAQVGWPGWPKHLAAFPAYLACCYPPRLARATPFRAGRLCTALPPAVALPLADSCSWPPSVVCRCCRVPQVLLEVHNTHHYLQFFKAIRASIAAGTFAAYHEGFLQRRQRLLMGAGW